MTRPRTLLCAVFMALGLSGLALVQAVPTIGLNARDGNATTAMQGKGNCLAP